LSYLSSCSTPTSSLYSLYFLMTLPTPSFTLFPYTTLFRSFFDFKDGEVKRNKLIDNKISTPLFTLPLGAIASHKAPIALMQRNLLRHITWSMPSGQSIARAMGVDPLSAADLEELKVYDMDLE